MLIKAEQKFIRISPRKVRLVVDAIKNLALVDALDQLTLLNKAASLPVAKVLKQAIANAAHNHNLKQEQLEIDQIQVNPGPTFKRWQPVSRGRAHSILKRTSHVRVALKIKQSALKSVSQKATSKPTPTAKPKQKPKNKTTKKTNTKKK